MGQQRRLPTGQMIAEPQVPAGSGVFDPTGQPGLGGLSKRLRQAQMEQEILPSADPDMPGRLPVQQVRPDLGLMLEALRRAQQG